MTKIKGYLIQDQEGNYLSHDLFWFSHNNPEDAWVHPENKLEGILAQSGDWKIKPSLLTRAIYASDRDSTSLISNPINILGLDVEQVKEILE